MKNLKTIVNEREKYEQMKESIRNTKSKDELRINYLEKIVEMHKFKKNFCFVLCI